MYELSIFFRDTLVGRSTFTKDELRIGRSADNDVQIDNLALSRHHAGIEHAGGAYVLKDFGSTNGSFVNGERIVGRRALTDGDRIGIGKFTIVFRSEKEAAVLPEVHDPAAYAIAGETAQIDLPPDLLRRPYRYGVGSLEEEAQPGATEQPRAYSITRDLLTAGSASSCDVVIPQAAPRIAAIVRAFSGFLLLAFVPGVTRNGEAVEMEATLADGDALALGGKRFIFRAMRPEAGP